MMTNHLKEEMTQKDQLFNHMKDKTNDYSA